MKLRIVTPQFERPANAPKPTNAPNDDAGRWERLAELGVDGLKAIGCGQWNSPSDEDAEAGEFGGGTLMLFPHEWYEHIPDGLPVVDIFGREERFRLGKTDDDKRFGCLSFGVIVPRNGGSK